MASTQAFQKINLTSSDIPGAYIDTDNLDNFSNTQLKRWLECRGLKQAGNRSDLLQRCKDVVNAGKEEDIDINVDGGKWYDLKQGKLKLQHNPSQSLPTVPPIFGWKPFPSKMIPTNFNYGHIYHYLLESVILIGQDGKSEDTDLAHMTAH